MHGKRGGGIFLSVKRNFGQVFVWGDATTVLIFSAARPYEEEGGGEEFQGLK